MTQERFAELREAMDTLGHAVRYLAAQYRDDMKRWEARAHFEARNMLIAAGNRVCDIGELELLYELETKGTV